MICPNEVFCCPYCKSELLDLYCDICKISFRCENGIYYFYNIYADHWKKVMSIERFLWRKFQNIDFDELEKTKIFGQYQEYQGEPYFSADKILDAQANAALLNYSYEIMHKNLIESDGYIIVIGARSLWESYFLARYKHVLAIDISDDIRYINPKFKNGITRIVCDGMFLPIKESVADLIFMNATFHHMEDKVRALTEWHRVLKDDGMVIANGEYYCTESDWGSQEYMGEYSYTYEMFWQLISRSKFTTGNLFPIRYCENMQYKMGIELTGKPDNGIIVLMK